MGSAFVQTCHSYGGGVGKFHTNPGGKYVYRGYGSKFHTNPGGRALFLVAIIPVVHCRGMGIRAASQSTEDMHHKKAHPLFLVGIESLIERRPGISQRLGSIDRHMGFAKLQLHPASPGGNGDTLLLIKGRRPG